MRRMRVTAAYRSQRRAGPRKGRLAFLDQRGNATDSVAPSCWARQAPAEGRTPDRRNHPPSQINARRPALCASEKKTRIMNTTKTSRIRCGNPRAVLCILALAASGAHAAPAHAADWYVNPGAMDDDGCGKDVADPCGTVAHVIYNLVTSGDVVHLAAGTHPVQGIYLERDVTLVGQGEWQTFLDAGNIDRHFDIINADIRFESVTLQHGRSFEDGGAVLVESGSLEVSQVRFLDCTADQHGGAIALLSGHLELGNAKLRDNHAADNGGAIAVMGGTLTVRDSKLSSNGALNGGAVWCGFDAEGSCGGARILDSLLRHNTAELHGGGISSNADLVVRRSHIADNIAGNEGGGIHLVSSDGLEITRTQIDHNAARFGGGVFAEDADAVVTRSAFVANTANVGGGYLGGAPTIVNSTFSANYAEWTGGALSVAGAHLSFCTLVDNQAGLNQPDIGGALVTMEKTLLTHRDPLPPAVSACTPNGVTGSNNSVDNPDCGSPGVTPVNSVIEDLSSYILGGDPQHHAINVQASPTIDAALDCLSPLGGLTRDQLDLPRPVGSACDLGAYELQYQ